MKHSETIQHLLKELAALKDSTDLIMSDIKAIATKIGYFYKVGDKVSLGYARVGTVVEIFRAKITLEIDGTSVTKEASESDPAYLIKEESGHAVLRLATEIDSTSREA
jgi:hypothetical protein